MLLGIYFLYKLIDYLNEIAAHQKKNQNCQSNFTALTKAEKMAVEDASKLSDVSVQ